MMTDVATTTESASNAPPRRPCTAAEARQFDFWLGEWAVTWGEGGSGTNRIQAILDGCVVREEFDGRPSIELRGTSVSCYHERQGVWKQTWVDNQGNYLDFTGGWEDGEMRLQRETTIEGVRTLQRMVWFNIRADELDWNWERSRDGGETWEVLWHIHYRRKQLDAPP